MIRRLFSFGVITNIFLMSTPALADVSEERVGAGSHIFVPTTSPINPAANSTAMTIVTFQQMKRDEHINFVVDPNGGNNASVDEKVSKKDMVLGGQYPLGGASLGFQYAEYRRSVSARNENRGDANHELFVNRDYRMNFGVDLLPELRAAFTFHYTALNADFAGAFNVDNDDHTHYHGSLSGYGLGVNYHIKQLAVGAFSHPPARGKATIEGEQKIVTEPGLYGLNIDFKGIPRLALNFSVTRWSYKHDERDGGSTSPRNQTNILLRGLDLSQYFRKTMAYGIAGEYAVLPMLFVKGQYLRQEGVFLFDPDHVPGDDTKLETRVRFPEYRVGVGTRYKDFIAEFGLMTSKASAGSISSDSGFRDLGGYTNKTTSINLMLGAAF